MKLLATDYDGTLKYGATVMPEDLEAIQEWRDAGNLFVIATGRSYESIKKQMDMYNISCDYLVTNGGAMVLDGEGKELYCTKLDYVTGLDIIFIAKEMDNVASYCVKDGKARHKIVVNPSVHDVRYPTMQPNMSEEEIMDAGNFVQIEISMADQGAAHKLAEDLNQYFGDSIHAYSDDCLVGIIAKGINKATGLEFVSAFEDVDDFDVYTIGDSYSDIPLMEYGMNGAAMEISYEDVKEHALYTYNSVGEMIHKILSEE